MSRRALKVMCRRLKIDEQIMAPWRTAKEYAYGFCRFWSQQKVFRPDDVIEVAEFSGYVRYLNTSLYYYTTSGTSTYYSGANHKPNHVIDWTYQRSHVFTMGDLGVEFGEE